MITDRLLVFKKFALDLAGLSKCEERQVAAIITDNDLSQVYSIGVNGGPKGQLNCLCKVGSKYGCIHAEINALIKCKSEDPSKIMFITLAPCIACATAIVNAPGGFSAVYYFEDWKEDAGIKILLNSGMHVARI